MWSSSLAALFGGALIGVAASALWLLSGRIAGVSGIVGGLGTAGRGERSWRAAFLLGLLAGGLVMAAAAPGRFGLAPVSVPVAIVAGLLVGVGTTIGNGCTSGHGVCGISRLSRRSLAATATFMLAGALTVYAMRHLMGSAG